MFRARSAALLLCLSCWISAADAAEQSAISAVDATQCSELKARQVLHANAPVGCERLRVVRFSYVDFDGRAQDDGAIMVLDAVAPQVQAIFDTLYARRFPLAKARLMQQYDGDDQAAMRDNNSSAFNHRALTGGGARSLHAYGVAIDVNPLQNPYIHFDPQRQPSYQPLAGAAYAQRQQQRPGMVEPVVELFAEHGFAIWGGDWHQPIDYQHFQLSRSLAERLARLPAPQAAAAFRRYVARYRACRHGLGQDAAGRAKAACATSSER